MPTEGVEEMAPRCHSDVRGQEIALRDGHDEHGNLIRRDGFEPER
jgi:hypothetical protein